MDSLTNQYRQIIKKFLKNMLIFLAMMNKLKLNWC